MIINFEKQKQKKEINDFNKHGTIPQSMLAGDVNGFVSHSTGMYSICLLVLEQTYALETLYSNLLTTRPTFKYLYAMQQYRKGMNPLDALHQEIQRVLFASVSKRNKYQTWILNETLLRVDEILNALNTDIADINHYFERYKSTPKIEKKELQELLSKLLMQHTSFANIKNSHT